MDNKKLKKNKNKSNKVIVILTSLFITSTIGSLTGTYAWFEYSARARLAYHGTAISEHKILEIGLWSPVELKDAEKYNLYKDPVHPDIYWASNVLNPQMIGYYTDSLGYANDSLSPLTSSAFKENDDFILKKPPYGFEKYDPNALAENNQFVHLSLRFRARAGLSLGDGTQKIVLNNVETKFDGEGYKGARIHFNSDTSNFIFNPIKDSDGSTRVSGPLDLNNDGFYDVESISSKEFCYGEYDDESLVYDEQRSTNTTPMDVDTRSCFNSAHAYNAYVLNTEKSILKAADYYGKDSVLLNKELTRLTPENRVASLDLDIYLEGWENSIIESTITNKFSLDLTFEVQEI